MLHLENNKVQIWEQYHFREYSVLSYLVRQDKWCFKAWCWRGSDGEYSCVTAGKFAVTQKSILMNRGLVVK
ncbi:hypothetical protein DM455_12060 [Legionella pneumophila]|nr:hypothetical protein [Legionella pneumophila]PYB48353.1 hypothetical protein DM456_13485 [Legionella pneumophila]PYB60875.1 hypothetical protein DM455_12060 [Legionella pneumophila]TID58053.1 hypothetical protein DIZ38_13100 [Legionella pneumophila]TID76881.1 hypothetical protein DIZ59_11925 [Legionella pneumophila]TID83764.1 hypothetical protein DIZ62_12730 [Legionella pneumophila]